MKRGRKKLVCPEHLIDMLGVVPDTKIAELAGVSSSRPWRF